MESNLQNDQYYSLSQLFSTAHRKIIIPDFQRDYCWGDSIHGEKQDTNIIGSFIDTLIEEFKENKDTNIYLGKIDVYTSSKNLNTHIYLTDGQQRLTSLYLLLGMLYRVEPNQEIKENLKNSLISDYELNDDDQEPYLQYAVRETTVFFSRDLVNLFFLNPQDLKAATIINQNWYFNDYHLDPSIKSMLFGLDLIEKKINELKNYSSISEFSEFILNRIQIQYHNVENKKHGEERFVIINTTGKSLTSSENIKPILLANINDSSYAKKWETREDFFWKNRFKNESIADYGVNDFLTWSFKIYDQQEELDLVKRAKQLFKEKKNQPFLDCVHSYFKALYTLLDFLKDEQIQQQIQFITKSVSITTIQDLRKLTLVQQHNLLLPLISYLSKNNSATLSDTYLLIRRLRKNYFDMEYLERKNDYVDWRYILQIINKTDTIEELLNFEITENSIKSIQKIPLNNWYNEEEKAKTKLKHLAQDKVFEWEDHEDFMGNITPLLHVVNDSLAINELDAYYRIYLKINPNQFTYTTEPSLGNLYRLLNYLKYGHFEHRSVAGGWGYCMLIKPSNRLFLNENFDCYWKAFKTKNEIELKQFFEDELKQFFHNYVLILNHNKVNLSDLIGDIRKIGHYERVFLWAILEYLLTDEILEFNANICQFWEYPNLVNIIDNTNESVANNYTIGNLLLGTSYKNNKTGWIQFHNYPLMKKFHNYQSTENYTDDLINQRTKELSALLYQKFN